MTSTAIIFGGARREGNTRKVIDAAAHLLSADVFDVSDYHISFYDYEHKNRDDDFLPLVKKLLEYDCWIFASPVYWYTMSAQLKVFFDRMTDVIDLEPELAKRLAGHKAALIASGAEESCPLCYEDVFIHTFNYLEMSYQGCFYLDSSKGVDVASLADKLGPFVQTLLI